MRARVGARLLATLLAIAIVVGVALVWGVEELRWRAQVLALVAPGQIPDLGFVESLQMLRPGSQQYLRGLLETRNPYASILNPASAPSDIQTGATVFQENCAGCHGVDARGHERAPALVARSFAHG